MLFKVQVFPHDYNNSDWEPTLTLHTCCDPPEGRLLTVGRKKGEILFASDKSVSREHGILRLVSSKTSTCPPRNDKESDACKASSTSSCLVLEGVGKLGTFLVQRQTGRAAAKLNPDDSDATDDEEAFSQYPSQASATMLTPLSPVAKHFSSSAASLRLIEPNESVVLSLNSPSIIQFGKLGSTVVVIPLSYRILRVSSGKQPKLPLFEKADQLGIVDLDTVTLNPDKVSHLVTQSRYASPKQLGAWSMGIPSVTNDYWKALCDRKSPSDPMPEEINYAPAPAGS